MAKGITQDQVHTAADALVAAGERPTVERIRAVLGTGSPNTVTRLLESWWQELGGRLTAQQIKVRLPEAPAAVAALASQLWEQALLAAQAQAAAALEAERQGLANGHAVLEIERRAHQQALETQQAAVAAAQQAQTLAEARWADAQRLAEQQGAQIADLTQQRNAALARTSQLEANLAVLSDRLTQRETAATAEREAQAQHVLAVENRAHQEVDRARQETKEVRSQFAIALKEHRSVEQRLRDERDQAINDVVSSQRDAAMERSRADALTQQLAQINDRIARASATPPVTKSVRSTKPTRKRKGRTGDDRLS